MTRKAATILHADDSDADVMFLELAFAQVGNAHNFINVPDGKEAIRYLTEERAPDLVLLDLHMPKVNGFEVLGFMLTKAELKGLPAIVLSASDLVEDMERAKKLGARAYIVKRGNWKTVVEELNVTVAKLLGI